MKPINSWLNLDQDDVEDLGATKLKSTNQSQTLVHGNPLHDVVQLFNCSQHSINLSTIDLLHHAIH